LTRIPRFNGSVRENKLQLIKGQIMKRLLLSAALAAGIAAVSGPAIAAPPTDAGGELTLRDCGFKVEVQLTGKSQFVETGAGEILSLSPGQKVTLTNPENDKTVSYVITGSFHISTDPATGNTIVTATGTNLLTRTLADEGIYLTTGNFSFETTAKGKIVEEFEFDGPGQVVDVCAELA
jgi:hypothetical protein